ncbi:unnamed protein product [Arctia plantaginis]|uniref:Uncharacterized protein n=1 Tax=Arctia plantaginis TaxID=874455 RepID=A0A8S0Z8L2_ARCPL|nr:unnamed protein product [Arctia plantaginis]
MTEEPKLSMMALASILSFGFSIILMAEQVFKKIYPGEEFLARASDPEEIMFEYDVNHGPEFQHEHEEEAEGDAPKYV